MADFQSFEMADFCCNSK